MLSVEEWAEFNNQNDLEVWKRDTEEGKDKIPDVGKCRASSRKNKKLEQSGLERQ